jgi:hypothetical protein
LPALVLGAAEDMLISPEDVVATAERLDVNAEILPHMGHMMMLDTAGNARQSVCSSGWRTCLPMCLPAQTATSPPEEAKKPLESSGFRLRAKRFGAIALDPAKPGLSINSLLPQPSVYSLSPLFPEGSLAFLSESERG